jgi:hypothetical protein
MAQEGRWGGVVGQGRRHFQPAGVHWRRLLVKAVISEHGERACGGRAADGRQVKVEGDIATGAVIADLHVINPHAAVE